MVWLDKKTSESNRGTFVPPSRDTRFLHYQNAQILLTAARKGRDVTKRDIAIEIVEEEVEEETHIC